jgi:hypothetical protein
MNAPKVFISYSHDSIKHKNWVLELAKKLRYHGVDAILDQWELKPGDDIISFMEHSLLKTDRVLMICTTTYVEKANQGVGGVGYEKMIVTPDLLHSIDSNKLIPIIRQSGTVSVPTFLRSKLFIDFSSDDIFESKFEELIRTLHNAPLHEKPPVQKSPFPQPSAQLSPAPLSHGNNQDSTNEKVKNIKSISDFDRTFSESIWSGPHNVAAAKVFSKLPNFSNTEMPCYFYSANICSNGEIAVFGIEVPLRGVLLWDLKNNKLAKEYSLHSTKICNVSICSRAKRVLSVSTDGDTYIWDIEKDLCIRTLKERSRRLLYRGLSPNGKQIISLTDEISVWDVDCGMDVFRQPTDNAWCISLSSDGKKLATGHEDNHIRIWDVENGGLIHSFECGNSAIWTVAWSPSDKYLVAGSWKKNVFLIDADSGTCKNTFGGHSGHLKHVSFSPKEEYFLSMCDDRMLRVWDLKNQLCAFACFFNSASYPDEMFNPNWHEKGHEIFIPDVKGNIRKISKVWEPLNINRIQK